VRCVLGAAWCAARGMCSMVFRAARCVRGAADVRCGGYACVAAVFGVVTVPGAVAGQTGVARHGACAAGLMRSVESALRECA
jgi:hypothetical protein